MAGRKTPLLILGASALIACAAPVAARDVYECSFPQTAANLGYLAPLVIMSPAPDGQRATIVDGFIQDQKGGPIEVEIDTNSDRKLSLDWTIMLQGTNNDYVKMYYRLSVQKQGLSASLVGRPQGFSNTFTAPGTCKRRSD